MYLKALLLLASLVRPLAPAPPPAQPPIHHCPYGYVCFYQNKDFGGRMVKAQKTGTLLRLSTWHFADQTSSWVDNEAYKSCGVEVDGNNRQNILWFEGAYDTSAFVGKANNDKADAFFIIGC